MGKFMLEGLEVVASDMKARCGNALKIVAGSLMLVAGISLRGVRGGFEYRRVGASQRHFHAR